MKFKDLKTGNILETSNKKSIELMQKNTDKYLQVTDKEKKTAAKAAE